MGNPARRSKSSRKDGRGAARWVAWRPRWIVDLGTGGRVGIATKDDCFVILYPRREGGWRAGEYLPREVAEQIAVLLETDQSV